MEWVTASTFRHSMSMELRCAQLHSIHTGCLSVRSRSVALARPHVSSDSLSRYHIYASTVSGNGPLSGRHLACAAAVRLDEETSSLYEVDHSSDASDDGKPEELNSKRLSSDELKSLLADSERAKLIRKLSDANQYNRFLKRQLQTREDALGNFRTELAVLELELQALVGLAEEAANSSVQVGLRKTDGKYIQSHLLSRLEAIHEKVKEQIKDVVSLKFEEVCVSWIGMAESVQVMGSFDGWSQGEEMSPEYAGDYARFAGTLKLRPGRYEIKFLVDGEWRLSPEFPTVGQGMMKNNLLIVDSSSPLPPASPSSS